MCTAVQYEELMAEPALAGVRMVAVTVPGMGGTPAPQDLSIENPARLAAQCAADLGCDVVVGFSMGANIALEMAASGAFRGPLVLLAPSFSRADEAVFFRLLDRLALVLGYLPFAALLKMMGPAMKRMPLPPDRREVLAAEFRRNDPRIVRRGVHCYFQYLDRHGSVASRLCEADVPAWVVHGERGDGGVTDDERRTLEACPQIRVITLPGASYFTPNEEPALVAKLVIEALDRVHIGQDEQRSEHREGGRGSLWGRWCYPASDISAMIASMSSPCTGSSAIRLGRTKPQTTHRWISTSPLPPRCSTRSGRIMPRQVEARSPGSVSTCLEHRHAGQWLR
jgi:pimeloyl-ACP methyl ester carboxylesterase